MTRNQSRGLPRLRKEKVDKDGHSFEGPCGQCIGWHGTSPPRPRRKDKKSER